MKTKSTVYLPSRSELDVMCLYSSCAAIILASGLIQFPVVSAITAVKTIAYYVDAEDRENTVKRN